MPGPASSPSSSSGISAIVFDLGGVLIDWNPRYLYRRLFAGDEAAMEAFLAEICTMEWNIQQDGGRSWAEAAALLKRQHPEKAGLIDAYHLRWEEMLGGAITGSVAILRRLKAAGWPLFALTNWSRETFPTARRLYDFLGWFDGIVVSGEVRLIKPDPRIYHLLCRRHGLEPRSCVFIDDNPPNVAAAAALGMRAIRFVTPEGLAEDLARLGLLPAAENALSIPAFAG